LIEQKPGKANKGDTPATLNKIGLQMRNLKKKSGKIGARREQSSGDGTILVENQKLRRGAPLKVRGVHWVSSGGKRHIKHRGVKRLGEVAVREKSGEAEGDAKRAQTKR